MKKLTPQEIAKALDAIDETRPEEAHAEADELLLNYATPAMRAAYKRLIERCPWWAHS